MYYFNVFVLALIIYASVGEEEHADLPEYKIDDRNDICIRNKFILGDQSEKDPPQTTVFAHGLRINGNLIWCSKNGSCPAPCYTRNTFDTVHIMGPLTLLGTKLTFHHESGRILPTLVHIDDKVEELKTEIEESNANIMDQLQNFRRNLLGLVFYCNDEAFEFEERMD
jgi:hypothetical protein